jgi:hypothetical protein
MGKMTWRNDNSEVVGHTPRPARLQTLLKTYSSDSNWRRHPVFRFE